MKTAESRKTRIIAYAARRFTVVCPSAVTMDDIARGVAIFKAADYFRPDLDEHLATQIPIGTLSQLPTFSPPSAISPRQVFAQWYHCWSRDGKPYKCSINYLFYRHCVS